MTQEDKQLVLADLCARLPFGLMVGRLGVPRKVLAINPYNASLLIERGEYMPAWYGLDEVKPYHRPMSSMTEEEKREIYNWLVENDVHWFDFSKLRLDEILISFDSSWLLVNWLLKNHFDFMGLIPKGLAIAVTEESNPYKK